MRQHTVIVGAGITGLCTAFALAQDPAARITLIERGAIPNPLAASTDHHRLIRFPYGSELAAYTGRVREALDCWESLFTALPADPSHYLARTGILALSCGENDYTDASRRVMQSLDIAYQRIDADELTQRLPFLDPDGVDYALLSEGGALMANRILIDLADWLRSRGVTLLEHSPVAGIDSARATVRLHDGRHIEADSLLVAAGIDTPRLLPEFGALLAPHRTLVVYADPPDDLRSLYAGIPCWTDLGGDDDLWGMPAIAGLPMKFGCGAMGMRDSGAHRRDVTLEETHELLQRYRHRFRGIDRFRLRYAQANYWTETPGSRFVFERCDAGETWALCACAGHGFKFGALTGRDVADALSGRVDTRAVSRRLACLPA